MGCPLPAPTAATAPGRGRRGRIATRPTDPQAARQPLRPLRLARPSLPLLPESLFHWSNPARALPSKQCRAVPVPALPSVRCRTRAAMCSRMRSLRAMASRPRELFGLAVPCRSVAVPNRCLRGQPPLSSEIRSVHGLSKVPGHLVRTCHLVLGTPSQSRGLKFGSEYLSRRRRDGGEPSNPRSKEQEFGPSIPAKSVGSDFSVARGRAEYYRPRRCERSGNVQGPMYLPVRDGNPQDSLHVHSLWTWKPPC